MAEFISLLSAYIPMGSEYSGRCPARSRCTRLPLPHQLQHVGFAYAFQKVLSGPGDPKPRGEIAPSTMYLAAQGWKKGHWEERMWGTPAARVRHEGGPPSGGGAGPSRREASDCEL